MVYCRSCRTAFKSLSFAIISAMASRFPEISQVGRQSRKHPIHEWHLFRTIQGLTTDCKGGSSQGEKKRTSPRLSGWSVYPKFTRKAYLPDGPFQGANLPFHLPGFSRRFTRNLPENRRRNSFLFQDLWVGDRTRTGDNQIHRPTGGDPSRRKLLTGQQFTPEAIFAEVQFSGPVFAGKVAIHRATL